MKILEAPISFGVQGKERTEFYYAGLKRRRTGSWSLMTGSERGRKKKGRQVPVKEEIGRASRSKEGGYSQKPCLRLSSEAIEEKWTKKNKFVSLVFTVTGGLNRVKYKKSGRRYLPLGLINRVKALCVFQRTHDKRKK
jgi:hypothetical protein